MADLKIPDSVMKDRRLKWPAKVLGSKLEKEAKFGEPHTLAFENAETMLDISGEELRDAWRQLLDAGYALADAESCPVEQAGSVRVRIVFDLRFFPIAQKPLFGQKGDPYDQTTIVRVGECGTIARVVDGVELKGEVAEMLSDEEDDDVCYSLTIEKRDSGSDDEWIHHFVSPEGFDEISLAWARFDEIVDGYRVDAAADPAADPAPSIYDWATALPAEGNGERLLDAESFTALNRESWGDESDEPIAADEAAGATMAGGAVYRRSETGARWPGFPPKGYWTFECAKCGAAGVSAEEPGNPCGDEGSDEPCDGELTKTFVPGPMPAEEIEPEPDVEPEPGTFRFDLEDGTKMRVLTRDEGKKTITFTFLGDVSESGEVVKAMVRQSVHGNLPEKYARRQAQKLRNDFVASKAAV